MARIVVLDEKVINRIAAGEVVERPVSVVKELMENSLDAEASSIELDIEDGGKKLIRVRDDGTGIGSDDAFLALERHATSKIKSEKDIVGVGTMGFRGEALASIASVSRLKLMTSDGAESGGVSIVIEGGTLRSSEALGMAQGTVIEVRNLFFNVPVRRKFLKSANTEAEHIFEMVTKMALARPEVRFKFRQDGRIKFDAPPVKSTLERVYSLYPKDIRENLMPVDHTEGQIRVHGHISRPPYARANMRSVLTFVNGRTVRDRLINTAVTRAFANLIEKRRYPLAFLFIELPPDLVDVNVHPQKAEVRFVEPQAVFNAILDAVYQALTGAPFNRPRTPQYPQRPAPATASVSRHMREERETRSEAEWRREADSQAYSPPRPVPASARTAPHFPAPVDRAQVEQTPSLISTPIDGRLFSGLAVVGTLPDSFILLRSDDELVIMDHHAAHERVLFEDLKAAEMAKGRFHSQDLLIPKVLEYSAVEARALNAHLGLLEAAGFTIEDFGETDFVVKSVPTWLGNADLEEFFGALVKTLLDTGAKGDPNALRESLLRDMACKAAVKETKNMHTEEIRALLADLDRVGSLETCPHGRPIVVRITLAEIRRKLGRK